jgi:hypothetical protein
VLGKYNILKNFEYNVFHSNVKTLSFHNDWKQHTDSYDGDIALLLLEKYVEFSSNIQPICLPPLEWKDKVLEEGKIAGWGLSERSGFTKVEEIPRKTKINAPPTNEDCFLMYKELVPLSSNRTFCAGGNNTGPCTGDSGGLLNTFVEIIIFK